MQGDGNREGTVEMLNQAGAVARGTRGKGGKGKPSNVKAVNAVVAAVAKGRMQHAEGNNMQQMQ